MKNVNDVYLLYVQIYIWLQKLCNLYFCHAQIDTEEGATLKFMTSSGLVTVYLSSEVPNPNEAVHDYKLETDGRTDLFIDPEMLGTVLDQKSNYFSGHKGWDSPVTVCVSEMND